MIHCVYLLSGLLSPVVTYVLYAYANGDCSRSFLSVHHIFYAGYVLVVRSMCAGVWFDIRKHFISPTVLCVILSTMSLHLFSFTTFI